MPLVILLGIFFFDRRIKSAEDVFDNSKLVFGGVIPGFKSFQAGEIFSSPKSLLAESFRNLKTRLTYMLKKGDGGRVLLVTSTRPGEGKTFCSENLASILAYGNAKVVVIGADMRRPQLFKDLNLKNERGLSDYLSEQSSYEDTILNTQHERLKVIVSGAIPPNPTELLDSERMLTLMTRLKADFDYVILDSTPLDIVADANVLIQMADLTIIVLRQNVSQKDAVYMLNTKLENNQIKRETAIVLK